MDRNEVSERLTGVLVSELGLDADKIADEAHFVLVVHRVLPSARRGVVASAVLVAVH